MSLGRVVLRTVVGGYFVGHGTQKLFGWFGGHGLDATAGMFGQLGIRPAKPQAAAAGLAEAGGGAALVLGAATPLASAAIIATMITAIRKVHFRNGPWVTDQGYEYNLVLIAAAAALAEAGPGRPSVDALTGGDRTGPKWALIALALGALGSVSADAISSRFPAPAAGDADAPPPSDASVDGSDGPTDGSDGPTDGSDAPAAA
jgi:putative oxidoreductase